MYKFPPLKAEIDAEGLHPEYKGIKIGLVLNPSYPEYEQPEEGILKDSPWLASGFFYRSTRIEYVTVPERLTDTGKDERVEIREPKDLWELESHPEFDPMITMWATTAWVNHRSELLEHDLKN